MKRNSPSAVSRLCLGVGLLLITWPAADGQSIPFAGPPIHYATAQTHDPVARMSARLDSGELALEYDEHHGYLRSVLQALDVPVSSQALVFSKTSLQVRRISPRQPRAIYFNDSVYVGWCRRGDVIELAATDPQQGAIFYTLKQTPDQPPTLVRDQGLCLSCHASSHTQNVPGYLVRSVFANFTGRPLLGSQAFTTDHTSPISERWGGWYVTGSHGQMNHLGNMVFRDRDQQWDRESGANLDSLEALVSTEPYLSHHSDIVALMVLEHQTQMHNAIAVANYKTRLALHEARGATEPTGSNAKRVGKQLEHTLREIADQLLVYLLMCNESPLEDAISGTSGFAADFQSKGKRDTEGRSLRDLDLKTRLFRYPCSYLIQSPAFAALPDPIRQHVLARLREILADRDDAAMYAHLSSETRRDILKILDATMPDFGS